MSDMKDSVENKVVAPVAIDKLERDMINTTMVVSFFKVSTYAIRTAAQRGELPSFCLPSGRGKRISERRNLYFRRNDVKTWIETNKIKTATKKSKTAGVTDDSRIHRLESKIDSLLVMVSDLKKLWV